MSLQIDIWSDIACPWCYIGKRRFEAALRDLKTPLDVVVRWRSFQLQPQAPARYPESPSHVERLARKYGTSTEQAVAMVDNVTRLAAAEGLAFDFSKLVDGNTFDAHRLLHWALTQGAQGALKERLMQAYFCEGVSPSAHDKLLSLVAELGLDVDGASAVLSSDSYAAAVRADIDEASRLGIGGVPFFRIGRFGVSGAQPPEVMQEALMRAFAETAPSAPEAATAQGPACTPEDLCE